MQLKYIEFENYKKITLIVFLLILFCACILPLINVIMNNQMEDEVELLVLSLMSIIFGSIFLIFIIIVLKNYNKIFYFKMHEKKFEYLIIPKQKNPSRGDIVDNFQAIYFKPTYQQKLYNNIINFERKGYNQIKMLIDDGSEITIRLHFSENKLVESLSKLNACLLEYKKNNN